MNVLVGLLGIAVGISLGWFLAVRRLGRGGDPIRKHPPGMEEQLPYRLSPALLTTSENACYRALLATLRDGQTLLAKVRFADLLQVTYGAGDRSIAHGRIANKVVDFLICDAELAPLTVVQLESTHPDRAEIQSRQFLRSVCEKVRLNFVPLPIKADYSAAELQSLPALQTASVGGAKTDRSPSRHPVTPGREHAAY